MPSMAGGIGSWSTQNSGGSLRRCCARWIGTSSRTLIRQMERHTRDQAYFLFLYNPIQLYAVNKAVAFVPYVTGYLLLAETGVTESTGRYGSRRPIHRSANMTWHRWLCILLIVLGSALSWLAGVVHAQAQTASPTRQADPDNAEYVALGQQVYASFCAGCHGANFEGQPNWQKRLPLGNLPAPPHDDSGHTGTMPTSGSSRSSSMAADTTPRHVIVAPCRPTRTCSPTPRCGPCWPLSKVAGRRPSGRSRGSRS